MRVIKFMVKLVPASQLGTVNFCLKLTLQMGKVSLLIRVLKIISQSRKAFQN